jgi:hypothetical protein
MNIIAVENNGTGPNGTKSSVGDFRLACKSLSKKQLRGGWRKPRPPG